MTPGCMMTPTIHHVRTPTLPRLTSPPLINHLHHDCPDPTPSPASANIPTPGENSPENCASGSASVNDQKPQIYSI